MLVMHFMMHEIFLHATVQMGVLRLKVLLLINHTFQWNMRTHSESTLLLHICIDSLQEFYMLVMNFKTQMFLFMREFVTVHLPIILTSLKDLIQMFL